MRDAGYGNGNGKTKDKKPVKAAACLAIALATEDPAAYAKIKSEAKGFRIFNLQQVETQYFASKSDNKKKELNVYKVIRLKNDKKL